MNKFIKILCVLLVLGGGFFTYKALQLEPDIALGSVAPPVTFTSLDGAPIALESLRGKFVLLDFWQST